MGLPRSYKAQDGNHQNNGKTGKPDKGDLRPLQIKIPGRAERAETGL